MSFVLLRGKSSEIIDFAVNSRFVSFNKNQENFKFEDNDFLQIQDISSCILKC